MNIEDFMELAGNRFDFCMKLLRRKDEEYGRGGDKLHNFKRAGRMLNITPEKALVGMWNKHMISLLDIIDDIDQGKLPTAELLSEKISDLINYTLLLEGLVTERLNGNTNK